MTVTDICEIIGVCFLGLGALASTAVWLLGVGQKLGKIVSATETSATELSHMTTQMTTVQNHLKEHSTQLLDLRTDVTHLQRNWPFRRTRREPTVAPLDAFIAPEPDDYEAEDSGD